MKRDKLVSLVLVLATRAELAPAGTECCASASVDKSTERDVPERIEKGEHIGELSGSERLGVTMSDGQASESTLKLRFATGTRARIQTDNFELTLEPTEDGKTDDEVDAAQSESPSSAWICSTNKKMNISTDPITGTH